MLTNTKYIIFCTVGHTQAGELVSVFLLVQLVSSLPSAFFIRAIGHSWIALIGIFSYVHS